MVFKCEECGKFLISMKDYNKETEDVSNGWQLIPKHKEEYCKKNKD